MRILYADDKRHLPEAHDLAAHDVAFLNALIIDKRAVAAAKVGNDEAAFSGAAAGMPP